MTSNSFPPLRKAIRISGTIGCVLTVILVLLAIPWIKFGIAYRGVKM
jgi:hypothetical protein